MNVCTKKKHSSTEKRETKWKKMNCGGPRTNLNIWEKSYSLMFVHDGKHIPFNGQYFHVCSTYLINFKLIFAFCGFPFEFRVATSRAGGWRVSTFYLHSFRNCLPRWSFKLTQSGELTLVMWCFLRAVMLSLWDCGWLFCGVDCVLVREAELTEITAAVVWCCLVRINRVLRLNSLAGSFNEASS